MNREFSLPDRDIAVITEDVGQGIGGDFWETPLMSVEEEQPVSGSDVEETIVEGQSGEESSVSVTGEFKAMPDDVKPEFTRLLFDNLDAVTKEYSSKTLCLARFFTTVEAYVAKEIDPELQPEILKRIDEQYKYFKLECRGLVWSIGSEEIIAEGATDDAARTAAQDLVTSPHLSDERRQLIRDLLAKGAVRGCSKEEAAAAKKVAHEAFRRCIARFSAHVAALIEKRNEALRKKRLAQHHTRLLHGGGPRFVAAGHVSVIRTARQTNLVYHTLKDSSEQEVKDLQEISRQKESQFQRQMVEKTKKQIKAKAEIADEEVEKIEEKARELKQARRRVR